MPMSSSSKYKSNGSHLTTFRRHSLSSSFAPSTSATFFARATSPTRAHPYHGHHNDHHNAHSHTRNRSSSSVRLSIDNRPISPNRSISCTRQISKSSNVASFNAPKRKCACSPTTHAGSFRCALHKRTNVYSNNTASFSHHSSSSLNYRRSAMTNSVVRIGGVEGEMVKRALTALIRPSSHHQRRRAAFEPRPSRLSVMSKGG